MVFVMARRTDPTPTMTTSDALAWLRAHDAKRAATFCEADGTVECWRKRYSRRANGQIVGFHDGASGAWEQYRQDVRTYVATAQRRLVANAAEAEALSADERRAVADRRAAVRAAVAQLRQVRALGLDAATLALVEPVAVRQVQAALTIYRS